MGCSVLLPDVICTGTSLRYSTTKASACSLAIWNNALNLSPQVHFSTTLIHNQGFFFQETLTLSWLPTPPPKTQWDYKLNIIHAMSMRYELSATLTRLHHCSHISSLVFELLSIIVALLKPAKSYLLNLYVSRAGDSFMRGIDQSIMIHLLLSVPFYN